MPTKADIGISGDFHWHNYTIPQGCEISGSTVTIHNPSHKEIKVRMQYTVKPNTPFIKVEFSKNEFTLKPNESKTIYITVRVLKEAVPGVYDLTVGGEEIYTGGGIRI